MRPRSPRPPGLAVSPAWLVAAGLWLVAGPLLVLRPRLTTSPEALLVLEVLGGVALHGIPLLLVFVLVSSGAWLLATYLARGVTSLGWPAVAGIVLSSEVWEDDGETGPSDHVEYAYEVGGRRYTSRHVGVPLLWPPYRRPLPASPVQAARGTHAGTHGECVAGYPPGARVMVYYSPRDPASPR